MSKNPLAVSIAMILTAVLVTPSVFFVAPPRAHAIPVAIIADIPTWLETTITAIETTLIDVSTFTSAASEVAQEVNAYILQPLAFILSGNLMKALTASVIAFVIGKANGTGLPQFATDIMASLRTAGNSQAFAYLDQFGRNSNSPFAFSISSALRTNYLQKSTLAGFWAANMNTLARSTPNVNGFLSGNWSQGGVVAWFSLTTQTQNNPYTLYQASESQLSGLIGPGVGGASGARLAQLSYGQGFLSWCGTSDTATQTQNSASADRQACVAACPDGNAGGCIDKCDAAFTASGGSTGGASATSGVGVNPGDPCTNKDGTPGFIKTPGSVISSTLNKVLGGQQDQIVRMGNVGPQITSILGDIATVLQTVQFASQILGGSNSGGLFGVAAPSSSNPTPPLAQNTPTQTTSGGFTSGYLGATNSSVIQNAASFTVSGPQKADQIVQYQKAWNTINASAIAASTTITALMNSCPSQVSAGQTALTTEIAPILAAAATASTTVVTATGFVNKVQNELKSGADAAASAYIADLQTLQTLPPTTRDTALAVHDAQATGQVLQNNGSLIIPTSPALSIVDQMNQISTNAANLQAICTQQNDTTFFQGSGG